MGIQVGTWPAMLVARANRGNRPRSSSHSPVAATPERNPGRSTTVGSEREAALTWVSAMNLLRATGLVKVWPTSSQSS